tara:strand:- start:140 stop:439 length:300 start_codon:yes stop_codon:yes gene_type:complete
VKVQVPSTNLVTIPDPSIISRSHTPGPGVIAAVWSLVNVITIVPAEPPRVIPELLVKSAKAVESLCFLLIAILAVYPVIFLAVVLAVLVYQVIVETHWL